MNLRRLLRLAFDRGLEEALGWTGGLGIRIVAATGNVRLGRRLRVHGIPIIRSPLGSVEIGDDVSLTSSSWRASASGLAGRVRLRTFFDSARIVIERGAGMNGGSITARSSTIRVGRETMIGPDCLILDSDFHLVWPPEQRWHYTGTTVDRGVTIGPRVWLGARCIVLKGVTIGENSVIAAGSIVCADIPANSLAAGAPAKVRRHLG